MERVKHSVTMWQFSGAMCHGMSQTTLSEDDTIGQLLKEIHDDEAYIHLGKNSLPTQVKCAPISVIGRDPAKEQAKTLETEFGVEGFYGPPLGLLNAAIKEHTDIDRSGVSDEYIPTNDDLRSQADSDIIGGETPETMCGAIEEVQSDFIDSDAN